MVTKYVRRHLYKLDDIYEHHRKDKKNHFAPMFFAVVNDYMEYWRELEDQGFYGLANHEKDELYFYFNEKLLDIARAHLDLYWLIFDYDEQPIYRDGREPEPFWRTGKVQTKRRIKKRALMD
ncbi:hypothetical protein QWI17_07355 [Gilvimarinus sp. SDUM040013]|uniref:Uncharacterized protein n=1 Tax=Gilvimarinus gilvus TaxID=3058038 RepID=A0ABU4S311_9GAMM|nr:hypothetical protein [Gilvimarinus sp. SDUM040013]MDO3385650.1 hypothetical protein [Gilvimarinus sp. SDUM040013]MDX6851560.1 hypothetical protein [Gilvimarinus sp. SDUM040013]